MQRTIFSGLLAIIFILLGNVVLAQNVSLSYFNASPDGADVLVSWEIPSESGVTDFKIYRKIKDETNYRYLDKIEPNGSLGYTYLDYTIFKDTPKEITYKLQVTKNGVVYNFTTTIVHNPTSVQRTWGSIKAMFKN
ncbi:MAG: hypothetical protein H6581_12850 [Bacteroidia bacterium]|nr:hypothetical protein [Bacteroidia bacterium]